MSSTRSLAGRAEGTTFPTFYDRESNPHSVADSTWAWVRWTRLLSLDTPLGAGRESTYYCKSQTKNQPLSDWVTQWYHTLEFSTLLDVTWQKQQDLWIAFTESSLLNQIFQLTNMHPPLHREIIWIIISIRANTFPSNVHTLKISIWTKVKQLSC